VRATELVLDFVVKRLQAEVGKLDSIYFAILTLFFRLHQTTFIQGQVIAALGAKTVNLVIKSVLAYRDRRLCELRSLWP
jgi:hypothetical protein